MANKIWVTGLLVLGLVSKGLALEASGPFMAITDQGRAMVGAGVNVTDSVGAPVTACSNAACSGFITQIPGSGLFQFWADPGRYNVTIAGSGITRAYTEVIPDASVVNAITDDDFPLDFNSLMRRTSVSGVYAQVKLNYLAAGAPTVNDDVSLSYDVGSTWVDTLTNLAYFCTDATNGAAVWRMMGAANVVDGTNLNDTLYWDGSTWTPTSRLVANDLQSGAGNTGLLRTDSTFQVGVINASSTLDIYGQIPAVILDTVVGQIRFGGTDSSTVPREAAFIKARAMDTWGPSPTSAATSLDFRVEANDGSAIGKNVLRLQPSVAIVGNDIPDNSLQGFARLVTEGISIANIAGTKSSVFVTPDALDVTVKSYTLPPDSGTAGYYLSTDGSALFPVLTWEPIASAPGAFAAVGQITTTAAFTTPSYSFVGDTNTGFGSAGGVPCIVDEAINGLCVTGNAADTFTSITGSLAITSGVTSNDSLNIISVGGSGNQIEVNSTEFVLAAGEVKFSGVSGDGTGKALCVKADGAVGTCSTVPNGSGVCTCG